MSNSTNSKDISVELPDIQFNAIFDTIKNSINQAHNIEFWLPVMVVLAAIAIGGLTRKILRPKAIDIIKGTKVSFRMNAILRNMTKLILPVTALILITIIDGIWRTTMDIATIPTLVIAEKLLVAWILIRMIAQIIENSFVRQIVASFGWAIAALSILGVLDQAKTTLDALGMDFGDFRLSLLTITKFLIALFILLTLSKFITTMAERGLHNATDLTPSARVLLIKIIKVTLVSLAILIGITAAGIDLSALAIFGGALGLGIGFGLQKVISNLFSGMLLLMDKSIKPGDIIEMRDNSGVFGWVSQLGARYVSIVTRDNKEYLIPNEDFITQPVINWSYTDRKIRVETKFGVSYDSDPHLVKKLGVEVASQVNRVCSEPTPVCHLIEFGDSSLNFVLRYWIEDAEHGVTNTKGDVMLALWDAFKENNITIPFPHRVLIDKRQ